MLFYENFFNTFKNVSHAYRKLYKIHIDKVRNNYKVNASVGMPGSRIQYSWYPRSPLYVTPWS